MKRFFLILSATSALLGLGACNEVGYVPSEETAGLNVCVFAPEGVATKGADVSVTGKESALNDVTVFLFDVNGSLITDGRQAATVSGASATASWSKVRVGTYTVAAVANFGGSVADPFANVSTLSALEAVSTSLGDNDPASGFVMAGKGVVTVNSTEGTTNTNDAELKIARLVSRIRLVSVENKTTSVFTVDQALIINGNSSWNIGGTGEPSAYFNWAGRTAGNNNRPGDWNDAGNHIIKAAADVQYAAMTFSAPAKGIAAGAKEFFDTPYYLYQNTGTVDHFDGPTDGAVKVRMVVRGSYGGKTYFYPVTIDKVERNKTYDVYYEISGPGSPDPNKGVTNGSLSVNVVVDTWGDGGDPILGSF